MTRRSFIGGLVSGFSLLGIAKFSDASRLQAKKTPPQKAVEKSYQVACYETPDGLRAYCYDYSNEFIGLAPVENVGEDMWQCRLLPNTRYVRTGSVPPKGNGAA